MKSGFNISSRRFLHKRKNQYQLRIPEYGTSDVKEFIQLNSTVSNVDKDGFSDPAPQCSAQTLDEKNGFNDICLHLSHISLILNPFLRPVRA